LQEQYKEIEKPPDKHSNSSKYTKPGLIKVWARRIYEGDARFPLESDLSMNGVVFRVESESPVTYIDGVVHEIEVT
jgi:hypothetical protein